MENLIKRKWCCLSVKIRQSLAWMYPKAAFPALLSWANTARIVFPIIPVIVDDSDPHNTEFGFPVSMTLARQI